VLLLDCRPATPEDAVTPDELAQLGEENESRSAVWQAIWLHGYATAAAQFDAIEARGYAKAVAEFKAFAHGVVLDLRQHLRTWDSLRENFGKPRPTDYPGKRDAA
jgi:hypothetical protein